MAKISDAAIQAQIDQAQKENDNDFQTNFKIVKARGARRIWEAGYKQAKKDHGVE